MKNVRTKQSTLPAELRVLVHRSVSVLGRVIERQIGKKGYQRIERLRQRMARLRGQPHKAVEWVLRRELGRLANLSTDERFHVVHSYALMLELMNACESAFRTERLAKRSPAVSPEIKPTIVFVLTAHPTEARDPLNIDIFHHIQNVLVDALRGSFESQAPALEHLLEMAWRLAIARRRKPSVRDEAEHIYSIVLRDENLSLLLQATVDFAPIYLRTWVGGDKDGHPGVDDNIMQESLQLSRTRLCAFVEARLGEVHDSLALINQAHLIALLHSVRRAVQVLVELRAGDGGRVTRFHRVFAEFRDQYAKTLGIAHPGLDKAIRLLRMFPALVVPLELRESSDVLVAALDSTATPAIARMMRRLAVLSRGGVPSGYARGFIVSMASSIEDMNAAATLVKRYFGALAIPVIPLFEQRQALLRACAVVEEMLCQPAIRDGLRRYWFGQFEVMLGYSDSAKEIGVLPSRLAIADAMRRLDIFLRRKKLKPVFFHGSGGSVDRGGGSVEEQTAWWPSSALDLFKATIQGEMVERTFASPEIARGQIERIVSQRQQWRPGRRSPLPVRRLADRVEAEYRAKVGSQAFLRIVQEGTAYPFLTVLKIGSRPTRRRPSRGEALSVSDLRAIPWVMCWTQTRVLFPTWWGLGRAWKETSGKDRAELRAAYRSDPLFRSFVKLLGFTLAKVELPVWAIYLSKSALDRKEIHEVMAEFLREYGLAVKFVRSLTGKANLLWFRSWLGESITLRAPMIHPLNLIQVLALKEGNSELIRETVTGISSGMMTTG